MEIYENVPIKHFKRFQRFEPVVQDHSAIIQAKKCFRAYFFRIVLGFVPKVTPQYFGFGSCYHKFREVLEKGYQAADPLLRDTDKELQMGLFAAAIDATRVLWKHKKMQDPQPDDKWSFLTFARLMESCAVAFKHWQQEKSQGRIKVLATEQNFVIPLPDGTRVAGKADQMVMWNGKPWGRDFKTSSKEQDNQYYKRTLDPNDQFTRYTWAESILSGDDQLTGQVQGQLVEVLYNAKSTKKEQKGPSIHVHMATRSPTQLQSWVEQQVFYNKILKLMRDEDMYPMEEASCSFCIFHSVCIKASENAMAAKLEAEFKIEPWDCVNRPDQLDE